MISFQGIFAQGFDQLLCCGIGGEVFSGGFLEMFAAQKYFIVITFKIPAERISRAIAAYEPTNNRSQLKKTENNELIIDAYNANPIRWVSTVWILPCCLHSKVR